MSFQAGGRGCFNCGDASHQARDCPKKGTPTCYNCGGMSPDLVSSTLVSNLPIPSRSLAYFHCAFFR
ncbi:hypothetical protein M752DRAFT_274269 [Aspergillus phoenicis ATCC 13157]|uniref:CCHC-type domain-containing protein n=2 Tax=Aspergillus TaxID=5052 RepID=A0A370PS20_ASPPH